jgi:hypothetical protein
MGCNPSSGRTVGSTGSPLSILVPTLSTLAETLTDRKWVRDIIGALSISALIEYLHLLGSPRRGSSTTTTRGYHQVEMDT